MIRFLTFGMLCGATGAVVAFTAGGGLVMTLLAYGVVGSIGLLSMALSSLGRN